MNRAGKPVRSAHRALDLLEVMTGHPAGLTFTEVMAAMGLPRSSTHDLLQTLVDRRYIEYRPDDRHYRLGARMLGLSADYVYNSELIRLARPHLTRLVGQLRETAYLAVLEGDHALYVAAEETDDTLRMAAPVGNRVPLHATAAGKLLLASLPDEESERLLGAGPLRAFTPRTITSPADVRKELSEVRRLGVAMDCEEYSTALLCVAVPVQDRTGKVAAALGLSVPAGRLDLAALRRASRALQDAAAKMYEIPAAPASSTAKGRLRIGISLAQRLAGFHRESARAGLAVGPAIEALQDHYRLEIIWANARESEAKQVTDIHQFLKLKVDAVMIQPVSNLAADVAFRELSTARIPAVCLQRPARSRAVRYFVGGDTFSEGAMQVEYVANMLGGEGKIALIEGDPYHENARNMALGALAALQRYCGLELIFNQSASQWSGQEAAHMVGELLASGACPDAIIAANDDMAGFVADVLAARGLSGRVVLVGGDGDRDALHRIRQGTQQATVFQDPLSLAREALIQVITLIRGQTHPEGMERRSILRSPVGPEMLVREVPYLLVSKENLSVLAQFWGE